MYIVWKAYQRRAEVLAPKLHSDVVYIPHLFGPKWLRPLDYCYKFLITVIALLRRRPKCVHVQAPPLYAALPALVLGIPYVLDTHNAVWQRFWGRLPWSRTIMKKAKAIVVHNDEIAEVAKRQFPHGNFITLRDPLREIRRAIPRVTNRVLFICSFDPGEPVHVIADVIEALPEFRFYITARVDKLPAATRKRLEGSANLHLTGFLSTAEYQELLCSSAVAVVLEEGEATQPSGACEALSSNTPLVLSRSSLTAALFGDWAVLVDNEATEIVRALRNHSDQPLDLSKKLAQWNAEVDASIDQLKAWEGNMRDLERGLA